MKFYWSAKILSRQEIHGPLICLRVHHRPSTARVEGRWCILEQISGPQIFNPLFESLSFDAVPKYILRCADEQSVPCSVCGERSGMCVRCGVRAIQSVR